MYPHDKTGGFRFENRTKQYFMLIFIHITPSPLALLIAVNPFKPVLSLLNLKGSVAIARRILINKRVICTSMVGFDYKIYYG